MAAQILQTPEMVGGDAVLSIPYDGAAPDDIRFALFDNQSNRYFTQNSALSEARTLIAPARVEQQDGSLWLHLPPRIVDRLLHGMVVRYEIPSLQLSGRCRAPDLRPTGRGAAAIDPTLVEDVYVAVQQPTSSGVDLPGSKPSEETAESHRVAKLEPAPLAHQTDDPLEPAEPQREAEHEAFNAGHAREPAQLDDRATPDATMPPEAGSPAGRRPARAIVSILLALVVGLVIGAGSMWAAGDRLGFGSMIEDTEITGGQELAAAREAIRRAERRAEAAESDARNETARAEAAEAAMQAAEERAADAEAAVQTSEERASAAESSLRAAEQRANEAAGDQAAAVQAAEERARAAEAASQAAEERAAVAEEAARAADQRAGTAEQSAISTQARLERLERDLLDARSNAEASQQRLRSAEDRLAALQAERDRLQEEIERLQTELDNPQPIPDAGRVAELERELQRLERRRASVERERDEARRSMAALRVARDALVRERNTLRDQVARSERDIDRLEAEVRRLRVGALSESDIRLRLAQALRVNQVEATPEQVARIVRAVRDQGQGCTNALSRELGSANLPYSVLTSVCRQLEQ